MYNSTSLAKLTALETHSTRSFKVHRVAFPSAPRSMRVYAETERGYGETHAMHADAIAILNECTSYDDISFTYLVSCAMFARTSLPVRVPYGLDWQVNKQTLMNPKAEPSFTAATADSTSYLHRVFPTSGLRAFIHGPYGGVSRDTEIWLSVDRGTRLLVSISSLRL